MIVQNQRVVVVGGGIVGTSIALGLSRRGVDVTVVEAGSVGCGTTSTSYAWINANGKEPDSYYAINHAGLEAHHALASKSGGVANWFGNVGHIEIADDEGHESDLRLRAEALAARGYRVEELTVDEARLLEPALKIKENPRAILYFPDEGYVQPLLYVAETLVQLRAAGVQVHEHAPVVGFDAAGSGVIVRTADGGQYPADQVVVAAGRWSDRVAQLAGGQVPLVNYTEPGDVAVGYLARTNAVPVKLTRVVTTPWLNVRPEGGGRLVIQALDLDATAQPENLPPAGSQLETQFLSRLNDILESSSGARIEDLLVGQRVMPLDGRTIASSVPGVDWMYAVATHSGVTLAPFLGKAVAAEVLGESEPLLGEFRLSRFEAGLPIKRPRRPRKPGDQ